MNNMKETQTCGTLMVFGFFWILKIWKFPWLREEMMHLSSNSYSLQWDDLHNFKLNLDRASRENLGAIWYGGICKDAMGDIMKIYHGAIGIDTNNSVRVSYVEI